MVAINLLPWRAMYKEQRDQQRKLFFSLLGGLIVFGLIIHMALGWLRQSVDTHIDDLKSQFSELDPEIQPQHFDPALVVSEKIQANQTELLTFLNVIHQTLLHQVSWLEIYSQKNHIIITGAADSFSLLAKGVNFYNLTNTLLTMAILHVKNTVKYSGVIFRLQVTRAPSPFIKQEQNDNANS